MELTRELKEIRERAFSIGGNYLHDVDNLLSLLESEMDKPKGTMVTTEKEQRVKCGNFLRDTVCEKYGGFTEKQREFVDLAWKSCLSVNGIVVMSAKSPERKIAEKYADGWFGGLSLERTADYIESAINEYKESVK